MDFLEFIFGVVKEAKPLLQKTASDIQLKTDISDYSKRFFNEKIESMPADINVDFEAFSDYCIEKLPQIIAVIDGSIQAADRESMKGTIIKCAIKEARANSESSRKLVETYVEAIFTLVAAWEWKRIDPATRKILVEHESSIAKLSEGIEEAFDKQTSKLLNSLDKAQTQPFSNKYSLGVNTLLTSEIGKFDSENQNNFAFLPQNAEWEQQPPPILKRSSRSKLVEHLAGKLQTVDWIQIVGKTWTGKSQLMILLAERFPAYIWINMKNIHPSSVYGLWRENLCRHMETSTYAEARKEFPNKQRNSIIFIDDMPAIRRDSSILSELLWFTRHGIKIISTSTLDMSDVISQFVETESVCIPAMTSEEIDEIVWQYQGALSKKAQMSIRMLKTIQPSYPAAIVSFIQQIISGKNIENLFQELLTGHPSSLEKELQDIIRISIPDEMNRQLLYRIAYAAYDLNGDTIQKIANIEPRIDRPYDRLNLELQPFVDKTSRGLYTVNRAIAALAKDILPFAVIHDVAMLVVDYIVEKKSLDQYEVCKVITLFLDAKEFDRIAPLYTHIVVKIMDEDNSNIEGISLLTAFWAGTKIDSRISIQHRIIIRLFQLQLLSKFDEDISYVLKDFIHLLNEAGPENSVLKLLAIGFIADRNWEIANRLFQEGIQNIVPAQLEIIKNHKDSQIIGYSFVLLCRKANTHDRIAEWFKTVKVIVSSPFYYVLDDDEVREFLFDLFNDVNELGSESINMLNDILDYAILNKLNYLVGILGRALVSVVHKTDGVNAAYVKYRVILQNALDKIPMYILTSRIVTILYDEKKFDLCAQTLETIINIEIIQDYLAVNKNMMYFIYAELSLSDSPSTAYLYSQKLADSAKEINNLDIAYSVRLFGERIIFAWKLERLQEAIDDCVYAIELILHNDFSRKEECIALFLNMAMVFRNRLFDPDTKAEGKLTDLYTGYFMFANNAPWFVDNHSAFKEYGLLVTFAQICEHFGQCEIASKMIVESAAKYIALEDKGSAKAYNIIETYPWSKLFSIMRIDEAYILLSDITEEWDKIGQLQCNQYLMPLCIELSFVILNAEKTVLEYHIQCLEKLSTAYTNYPLLSEFIDMLNDYIKPHNHATSWLERYHEKKAEFQETYGYLCYLFYAASPDSIPANAIIAFISVVRSLTTMYDPISDFFVCAHVVPFFNKFLVPTISRALGKDSRIAQSMKDMKENLFTLADTFGVKNSQEVEDWLLEY